MRGWKVKHQGMEEVRVARSVIDHFDNSERAKCAADVGVPAPAAADTRGP